ncbi:MAG: 3-deoxy-D-manno-octulosonic acid transferase [Nitrospirae bacterium]|nr:3-deoxy-D-manno-octulosonic acid transferase [Nitrospirota bacterium]
MLYYDLLAFIAAIILTPYEYFRRPTHLRATWLRERWGFWRCGPVDVWIHAVSVGEALAASGVVKELKRRRPDLKIAVSTVTDTGRKIALESMPGVPVFYMPWDIGPLTSRVLRRASPKVVAIMETELWPSLISRTSREQVPLVILNGRISDRSFRGYMRIRRFMRLLFLKVTHFGMQSRADLERIRAIGAEDQVSSVIGNLKFDIAPPAARDMDWPAALKHPVWIAGSTHEGEEEKVLSAHRMLADSGRNITLVIAPRHPQRFDAVERVINSAGFKCARRSGIGGEAGGVILLDAMGELASAYAAADVVFVGGSLVPSGGHNILEPAFWRKPVIFGNYMENFRAIAAGFIEEKAGIQVNSPVELAGAIGRVLDNPAESASMADRAFALIERNRGASVRCADILERHINRILSG